MATLSQLDAGSSCCIKRETRERLGYRPSGHIAVLSIGGQLLSVSSHNPKMSVNSDVIMESFLQGQCHASISAPIHCSFSVVGLATWPLCSVVPTQALPVGLAGSLPPSLPLMLCVLFLASYFGHLLVMDAAAPLLPGCWRQLDQRHSRVVHQRLHRVIESLMSFFR